MLESLLVLGIVSLLALGLSSSVQSTFAAVEEQIFFMEFEELYRETQKRSLASQQKMNLMLEERSIGNGYQKLAIPKGIQLQSNQSITFDKAGGNSSLASVKFQTRKEVVRYQQRSEQKEWLLFVDQLEAELNRAQFEKVENDRLYLKQEGKPISMGKSKSNDFRKTDASGRGYQPMVYGLKSARIQEKGQELHFHFQFEKGLEREFIYHVEKEKS